MPIKPNQEIFVFDLGLPILSQIKTVQKALLSEQKFRKARGELEIKATRNSDPASYQLYLRLLDGKAKGISSAKLGEVLFPSDFDPIQRTKDSLKSALRIRDMDYRFIPRPKVK